MLNNTEDFGQSSNPDRRIEHKIICPNKLCMAMDYRDKHVLIIVLAREVYMEPDMSCKFPHLGNLHCYVKI